MSITRSIVRGFLARSIVRGLNRFSGSTCNTYVFSDTNTDSLEFDSAFTGNIKAMIKADATDGIQADILDGLMGEDGDLWDWNLNGSSYAAAEDIVLGGDFEVTTVGEFSSDGFHIASDTEGAQRIAMVSSNRRLYVTSSVFTLTLTEDEFGTLTDGDRHSFMVGRSGGVWYSSIDGTASGSSNSTYSSSITINGLGAKYSASTGVPLYTGVMLSQSYTGITDLTNYTDGTAFFDLNSGYGADNVEINNSVPYSKVLDAESDYTNRGAQFVAGEWLQYEADVTAIEYIVDDTFNGVVGYFYLDDVYYCVDMGAPEQVAQTLLVNGDTLLVNGDTLIGYGYEE